MIKLLAFDLDWSDSTGWCYWDDESADPIRAYGDFKIKLPNKLGGAMKLLSGCRQIYDLIVELGSSYPVGYIVYEYTDWHRGLQGKGDWEKQYFIERQAQASLHRAEGAFLVACATLRTKTYHIGATEVKLEYGGSKILGKTRIAELVSQEFPRFKFVEPEFDPIKMKHIERSWYLIDTITGEEVSHHVSDAITIARVMAARLRQETADTAV